MPTHTYSQANTLSPFAVGVGLRSVHYKDALEPPGDHCVKPDFVEVHAENFFASSDISQAILSSAQQQYALSIHGTGMGLGSYAGVNRQHLKRYAQLVKHYQPNLVSDHACFALGNLGQQIIHAGDLLPIKFTYNTLSTFEQNLNLAQDILGRTLLIENICAYTEAEQSDMSETEFLTELCHRTGCGLLVDLNNLVVNGINQQEPNLQAFINHWLGAIPAARVGEFHLAGCSPFVPGQIMVDDHSAAITPDVWHAYGQALRIIGPRPTLIEWDTDLPSWSILLDEITKTKAIAQAVLSHERPTNTD